MLLSWLVAAAISAEPEPAAPPNVEPPAVRFGGREAAIEPNRQFAEASAAATATLIGGAVAAAAATTSGVILESHGGIFCSTSAFSDCGDTWIAGPVWFYGTLTTFAAAGGAIAQVSAGRHLLLRPAPPVGFVIAAGGAAVTLAGYVGRALRGTTTVGAAEVAFLGGPALIVGGVAVQYAMEQAAARHGFRQNEAAALTVVFAPTANGLAVAGTF